MLQSGERASAPSLLARANAIIRLKLALLCTEVSVGSPDLAAVGLVGISLTLQTIVLFSPGHFRPSPSPLFAVLVPLGTLASLAVSLVATFHVRELLDLRTRQMLAAAALLSLCVLSVLGVWQGASGLYAMAHRSPYNNDGAVMDLYAAGRVLHGHDPYLKTNIVTALAGINAPATNTTPLMDGQFRGATAYPSAEAVQQVFLNVLRYRPRTIPPEFESKYNYPSGSFLFILPFVWLGIHDMRFLQALAIVAMGAYLWFLMPRGLRLLVPMLLLADVPLVVLSTGGQPDPIYGVFLMIGYAEWRRRWVSGLTMGVAIATKQLAWFFVPFYLVLIAREVGWREAMRRCGLMALVVLAVNCIFILESPSAYLSSVMAPMIDPMFPLGIGFISLFVANVLPMLPKIAFSLAEIASWLAGIAFFARSRLLTAASGAALAGFPLFFAWRSLVNYFYLVPLIALAVVLADRARPTPQPVET